MRSEATLRRWIRALRAEINADNDPVVTRIAYALETCLYAAKAKKPSDYRYNPVEDARQSAKFLRNRLASAPESVTPEGK